MSGFANLAEGIALAVIGAFMIFAPARADQLQAAIPFIRIGGRLRAPFGWAAIILGIVLIAVWGGDNL